MRVKCVPVYLNRDYLSTLYFRLNGFPTVRSTQREWTRLGDYVRDTAKEQTSTGYIKRLLQLRVEVLYPRASCRQQIVFIPSTKASE